VELTTFGAVLGFAISLEKGGEQLYHEAAGRLVAQGEALATLARAKPKRAQTVERARRENVAEMILEAISGLDSTSYEVPCLPVEEAAAVVIAVLSEYESRCLTFYGEAAQRIGLAEVAGIFRRLARQNEEAIRELASVNV